MNVLLLTVGIPVLGISAAINLARVNLARKAMGTFARISNELASEANIHGVSAHKTFQQLLQGIDVLSMSAGHLAAGDFSIEFGNHPEAFRPETEAFVSSSKTWLASPVFEAFLWVNVLNAFGNPSIKSIQEGFKSYCLLKLGSGNQRKFDLAELSDRLYRMITVLEQAQAAKSRPKRRHERLNLKVS